MLHRFIAIVSRSSDPAGFDRARSLIASRLDGWSLALDTAIAVVWGFSAPPSKLGFTTIAGRSCLIGVDFNEAASRSELCNETLQNDDRSWGAFIKIAVDAANGVVNVVRDPTGRIDCWRIELGAFDVIFSHYEDVRWMEPRSAGINWDYIQYHLHNNWHRGEQTGLSNVSEILAGEQLRYVHGAAAKTTFWQPGRIALDRFDDAGEARRAIRSAAELSVNRWAPRYENIALDLSGGLDSAIVLGLLRGCARHPSVVGINFVIPNVEGDEREFARDAAALHSIELVEQSVSADTIGAGPSPVGRLMRPALRMLPLGYDEIGSTLVKRLAADAIFTGTGGDHLFYDYLGISAASDYRKHHGLSVGLLATAYQISLVSRNTIWNTLASVTSDMLPRRRSIRQLLQGSNPFLTDQGQADVNYERYAHPWLLAGIDNTPPAKLHQLLMITELQRHYMRYGRADIAEEIHPLFSQPLIEACLRVPAYMFCEGGVQRGLARAAFDDLLPQSIRNRRSKSGNGSHWLQVITRDLPALRSLMLDGRLVARGLLDRDKLEATLTPLGVASTQSFAALVNCLTTEMWVQENDANKVEYNFETFSLHA